MIEEWKEYKLGDVCQVINGRAYKQEELLDKGKYRVLRVGNIFQGNNWYYSDLELPQDKYCDNGDLLYAWSCGFAPYIWDGGKTIYHYHIWKLIEDVSIANKKFLYYYLIENTKHFLGGTHGSVMLHLTKNGFEQQIVKLPSLQTQQRIASILSSLDDKIECNRRINENLEQQAQALFKTWFVDFEPFRDEEFEESELGMIPKGWRVGTLNEIADITMGTSPSGTSYNADGIGDVFYQGRAEFGFRFPHRNLFTTEAKRFADVDTVLVSVRAPVGDINVAEERCCIGRGLTSVKSKTNCNSYILYLMQNLKPVFDRFNGEGTVFGSINKKAFEEMQIIIPTKSVVNNFESIVCSMDCQIKRTEQESRRLASLRDSLLPKLMNGELRVEDVKI